MTELKPCPFCGGEAVVDKYPVRGYEPAVSFEVRCSICGQKRAGGYFDTVYMSEELARKKAIETWNSRPSPWHTGTPTEERCFYVLQCKGHRHPEPYFGVVVDGIFSAINWDGDLMPLPPDLIAWQKIESYKEDNYGR